MNRREFITLLGGAALAWPSAAPALAAEKIHRIGYLSLASAESEATRFDAFRAGLAALGYVEGGNLLIEARWLDGGKCEQLASSAAQLVELNVDGNAVAVTVRDNGIGIPPEIRDKLFQPFFTTKPTGEGIGLGLSISYDIVTQQHGGTIAVDSRPGAFTAFTVRLPRGGGAVR